MLSQYSVSSVHEHSCFTCRRLVFGWCLCTSCKKCVSCYFLFLDKLIFIFSSSSGSGGGGGRGSSGGGGGGGSP